MILIQLNTRAARRPTKTSYMMGFPVKWDTQLLADGLNYYVAVVEDDSEGAEQIAHQAAQSPKITVFLNEEEWQDSMGGKVPAAKPMPASGPRAGAPVESLADLGPVAFLRRQAELQGWDEADLADFPPSAQALEESGIEVTSFLESFRGPRTGLLLSEMALVPPPENWATIADTNYPWDVSSWQPPGVATAWKTPMVPPKQELDPDGDDEAEPGEIADPAAYEGAKAEGVITELDPDDPNAAAGGNPDDPDGAPPADNKAIALDHWGDNLAQAQALLNEYRDEDGAPPSMARLNYRLNKAEIATCRKPHYEALLAVTPDP